MASLAQFRVKFAEFNDVDDASIVFALGEAALEMSPHVWGQFGQVGGLMTNADAGQLYLAAHKLAIGPFSQNAKTVYSNKVGYNRTTYGAEFLLKMRAVTGGFRVA